MKTCYKCKILKDDYLFPWQNKKANRRHRHCKECHKEYCKQWYRNNSSKHKKVTRAVNIKRIADARDYVASLNLKCTYCSENHPAVLDFHHLDPATKDYGVADLLGSGYSLKRIQEEISKCIVLCSNCHRKHHWNERNKDVQS